MIERKWNLPTLTRRDDVAADLSDPAARLSHARLANQCYIRPCLSAPGQAMSAHRSHDT
jgi:hypothetical protein